MREMVVSMSYLDIQRKIGCTRDALYQHLKRTGLVGISPHGKHKASSTHHVRVSDEFAGCLELRRPWSKVRGPLSYWQQQGMRMLGEIE